MSLPEPQPRGVVAVIALTILVDALALWAGIKFLNRADVIDWELPWRYCTGFTAGFVVLRAWDRAVFKKPD